MKVHKRSSLLAKKDCSDCNGTGEKFSMSLTVMFMNGQNQYTTCSCVPTNEEIEAMPTIDEGHFDDLKIDTGELRVWVSRLTEDDGYPGPHITYEKLIDGRWTSVETF